ncbi:interleukin-1 receptor-associated kinase 3-like isoform X22 [Oncorhynchus keta]|nr:interleukin-1 receptor-associated kinase 3-like isoform X22 [Oncorhynchus keta]
MDSSMYLYDVPPVLMEKFCKIIDSGDDSLGWRGLAARIVPSWTEVRRTERLEAIGKSPTRELIWSWAQQNKTVGDLVKVLEDMGHTRALQLFIPQETQYSFPNRPSKSSKDNPSPPQLPTPPPPASESTRPGWNQSNDHVSSEGRNHRLVITYSDVIEGTRHFHQDMKISEGSFSAVYRAVKGNETFAVKLFKQVQKASWRKLWDLFRREMEVHHLYQHPNILELLGCYSDGDRYWLVYPYLPNGSLFHRLHDQNAVPPLSWQERLDIIKGTAKAVHHLHMAQPCTVVCGNITRYRLKPLVYNITRYRLKPLVYNITRYRLKPLVYNITRYRLKPLVYNITRYRLKPLVYNITRYRLKPLVYNITRYRLKPLVYNITRYRLKPLVYNITRYRLKPLVYNITRYRLKPLVYNITRYQLKPLVYNITRYRLKPLVYNITRYRLKPLVYNITRYRLKPLVYNITRYRLKPLVYNITRYRLKPLVYNITRYRLKPLVYNITRYRLKPLVYNITRYRLKPLVYNITRYRLKPLVYNITRYRLKPLV